MQSTTMQQIFFIISCLQIKTVLFIFYLQYVNNGLFAAQTTIHSSTCAYTLVINQRNISQCPIVSSNQYGSETPHVSQRHGRHYKPYQRKVVDANTLRDNQDDLTDSGDNVFPQDLPVSPSLHFSGESRICQRRVASLVYRLEHLQQIQRTERLRAERYANSVKGHHSQLNTMDTTFGKLESNVSSLIKAVHSIEQKLFRLKKINNNLEHKMASVVLDMDEVNKHIGRRDLKATSDFYDVSKKKDTPEHSTPCSKVTRGLYKYEDCGALRKAGFTKSGEYFIQPSALSCSAKVWCDMETDGGGWTTFQRRMDGTENFFRNWTDYRDGFGVVSREFWLGNNNLFLLTNQKQYELRVDLWDFNHRYAYAKYKHFKVEGERDLFRIHVSTYSGTARNGLYLHNFALFSTIDRDNDKHTFVNCAEKWDGGWWFTSCGSTYLNGRYHRKSNVRQRGIMWNSWKYEQLMHSEMKIRPVRF